MKLSFAIQSPKNDGDINMRQVTSSLNKTKTSLCGDNVVYCWYMYCELCGRGQLNNLFYQGQFLKVRKRVDKINII